MRRFAEGVLLEPLMADPAAWFAGKLDRVREGRFLATAKERAQPMDAAP